MNIIKQLSIYFFFAITFSVFIGCSDDNEITIIDFGDFDNGLLISHEGSFSGVSGSVSYVSSDSLKVSNGIYQSINNDQLGIFTQSMGFFGGLCFIITDEANTIQIVNRYTFEKLGEITEGLNTPRYIAFSGNRAYVSNWGETSDTTDDFVAVINLENFTVTDSIPVALGPERVLVRDLKVYITHKGAFGSNNIVSVIDTFTNEIKEIEVGDNPDEIIDDGQGNIWVLSEGKTTFDQDFNIIEQTPGAIVKISPATDTVTQTIAFQGADQPSLMTLTSNTIYYYLNNGIYSISNIATEPSSDPIIEGSFYGMEVRNNQLYAVDAKDFSEAGSLNIFNLSNGEKLTELGLGVVPSKIYFN